MLKLLTFLEGSEAMARTLGGAGLFGLFVVSWAAFLGPGLGAESGPSKAKATTQEKETGSLQATQEVHDGWKTFHSYCSSCHGVDATGGAAAPDLRKSLAGGLTHDQFTATVRDGRPAKGMIGWKALLKDPQIESLYQYVLARSEGRLAPGEPQVQAAAGSGN